MNLRVAAPTAVVDPASLFMIRNTPDSNCRMQSVGAVQEARLSLHEL
jgi:hypothetical protein